MAASSKQPFEISDFSLGITDDPFESDTRYSLELDNYNIQPDGTVLTRPGSELEDAANPQLPSGAQRVGTLINYDNSTKMFYHSGGRIYYRDPSAFTNLVGPTSNDVFSAGTSANYVAHSEWNKQLFVTSDAFPRPMKIYKDSAGDYQVRTSGLPALASTPVGTPTAGANSYIYAFHHFYSYTVGSQTFEDVGPVTLLTVGSADAPDSNQIAISSIPVLANSTTDNWDTANVKVQIFRTTNAGQVFYKVGEVTNGTTTFNDTVSDTTLQTNLLIYTGDGTVEFSPVPLHKFVHIINNIAYYAHVKVGAVEFPFRIFQGVPAAPSAVPADFFIDVEDEVKGVGSVNSIPLVFCSRHVYRLEGNYDQFGRGGINPVRISDTAGCVSHASIVSAEGKIFWAGNDGFYFSDGYKVGKISDKNNARYKTILNEIVDAQRIQGKFDEENRRVIWAVQADSGSADNDTLINLELRWGVRESSTFATWSGESFRPSAIEFFDGKLYRGDLTGFVLYHDESFSTDPKVDITVDSSEWVTETIIWNYLSLNFNFGGSFFRKKPTRILLAARNIANTSVQVNAINDDGAKVRALKPIRWRRNFVWGDINFSWGVTACVWRGVGLIEQWRRFPARGLRLSYCQIQITNAYSVVENSDLLGDAVFDSTLKTVTLVDAATRDWNDGAIDYFISTSNDGYVRQYLVTERTADTLTVVDSEGDLPNGTYSWLLKGYQKGEPLNLLGYVIHVANEDQMQQTFESGDGGTNA